MAIFKTKEEFINYIRAKLIVSCQAVDNEPLNDTKAITLMAKAVIEGGAEVLRLSQFDHIKSITKTFNKIPVIGLIKQKYKNSEVFITPTISEVDKLLKLGVDCIALDATDRQRPKESLAEIVNHIKQKSPSTVIMADCATEQDIINANQLGFDVVGTTLRGYTQATTGLNNISNGYEFIRWAIANSTIPVIAEGGIWEPYQVREILSLGCHSVVVGSAITRPLEITKRFLRELN